MTDPHLCQYRTAVEWRPWSADPGWVEFRRCRVRRCRICSQEVGCEVTDERRRYRADVEKPEAALGQLWPAGITNANRWSTRAEVLARVGGDGHHLLDALDAWLRAGWIEVEEDLPLGRARWSIRALRMSPRAYELAVLSPRQERTAARDRATLARQELAERARQAVERYGPLGLRTLAHLASGDAHALDALSAPADLGLRADDVWLQPDALVQGSNVVRLGGRLALTTEQARYGDVWLRPGHFLWDWEAEQVQVQAVGRRLLLVENSYPYWELLGRWAGEDVTLVCIHGETRHRTELGSALRDLLTRIYAFAPSLPTYIWCDPDPGGVAIAANAYAAVTGLGGRAGFWLMDEQTLSQIEHLVLAPEPLRPLTDRESIELAHRSLPAALEPLRAALLRRNQKGEQEALALVAAFNSLATLAATSDDSE